MSSSVAVYQYFHNLFSSFGVVRNELFKRQLKQSHRSVQYARCKYSWYQVFVHLHVIRTSYAFILCLRFDSINSIVSQAQAIKPAVISNSAILKLQVVLMSSILMEKEASVLSPLAVT